MRHQSIGHDLRQPPLNLRICRRVTGALRLRDYTVTNHPNREFKQMTQYAFHPLADVFPLLEGGEYAALVEDIKQHGLQEPITLYEDKILEGRNRYRACLAAGVEAQYRRKAFASHDEARAFVISANIHRRHLTAEQKRQCVEQLLKANPEQSDRQVAAATKMSPTTVGKVRGQMEQSGTVSKLDTRTDRKGRAQPAQKTNRTCERKPISAET